MSAAWEYEDSDIYVADRRECEEPGNVCLGLFVGAIISAAFWVGLYCFLRLVR